MSLYHISKSFVYNIFNDEIYYLVINNLIIKKKNCIMIDEIPIRLNI